MLGEGSCGRCGALTWEWEPPPQQPSVYELIRAPGFAHLPLIVEDFVKDAGASFTGEPGLGRHRPGATAETQAGFPVLGGAPEREGGGLRPAVSLPEAHAFGTSYSQ